MMTIETDEQYGEAALAIERLAEGAIEGADSETFLELTAAMLDYELRNNVG